MRWRPGKNRTSPEYARGILRHGDRDLMESVERHSGLVGEFVDIGLVREARARFDASGALADAKRVWLAGQLAIWLAREERMKGAEQ